MMPDFSDRTTGLTNIVDIIMTAYMSLKTIIKIEIILKVVSDNSLECFTKRKCLFAF